MELLRWTALVVLLLMGQLLVLAALANGEVLGSANLLFTPVLGGDSGRYLSGSLVPETFTYASYIVTAQGLSEVGLGITQEGDGAALVVVFQMIVALSAARCLVAIGRQLGATAGGWVAASWFLVFFQIAQWTRYVLTESLFYSMTVITMWVTLHRFNREWQRFAALVPLLLFVNFLRPNGFVLIGAVAVFLIIVRLRRVFAIGLVGIVWLVLAVAQAIGPFTESPASSQTPSRFVQGEVFWNQSDFQRSMPPSDGLVDSFGELALYALRNPVDSMLLGASRIGWELIQVRPWYADYYNAALIVTMVLFYALSLVGWYKLRGSQLNLFIWSVTVPSILIIAATWAIYEGRFAWWFLVTWLPWVGVGTDSSWGFVRRVLKRYDLTGGKIVRA